jgi:hypothetical protein
VVFVETVEWDQLLVGSKLIQVWESESVTGLKSNIYSSLFNIVNHVPCDWFCNNVEVGVWFNCLLEFLLINERAGRDHIRIALSTTIV